MAFLTREEINAAQDIESEDIEVPEWGGTVRIRGLSAKERALVEATMVAVQGEKLSIKVEALQTIRQRLVGAALVDEKGQRVFAESEIRDLSKKSGDVIQRLFEKAKELSGMSEEAAVSAEKNSENGQNDFSDSD